MSRLLAELLIFLIATMAWAYLGIPILAQENVAILAQENAGPGKWEYTWGENLLGFGCLGAGVLLYLGMLYTALFKSKDSNYPKYAFAFGLLIASPLIGMVVGLVGAGLGWLVGSLFGNSAVGAGYGAGIGLWGTIIGSFINWLISFGRQD